MNSEKMAFSSALIEWESGGLDDVPTKNINEFMGQLITELEKRGEPTPASKVIELLNGIDENENDAGWWETATGAKFGRSVLIKIREALTWT